MQKKRILVTGADGQLGRAVNEEFADTEYELINTDVSDAGQIKRLDITDIDEVLDFTRSVKPFAILNCAALTAVDDQERHVDEAYRINAIGPRNMAIAARETGARLVHISTDYVFDGKGERPYTEFDPVCPVSTYGRTKLAGENFVREFGEDYFIIRTAWLYGDGKNFVKTMLALSEKLDEVSVVADQTGSPTSTAELARAVRFLLSTENYGLFHGTCEGEITWACFAERIFSLAGKETRVRHITSDEYQAMNPDSARRPEYSVLDNYILRLTSDYRFADWEKAIEEYIRELL